VDWPEVQIRDWMMPGMEGIQGCQKPSESKERPHPQEMLKLADDALYARKSRGETGPS
jgi:DNA-binding response OmpR family regulator